MKTVTQTKHMMVRSVRNGAKFLDSRRPLWYQDVDINILNMSSCTRCIVGQLSIGLDDMDATLGFCLYGDCDIPNEFQLGKDRNTKGWSYLADLWIKEILRRRRS